MTEELIITIASIMVIISFLYIAYYIAKKNPEFSIMNLAFCVLFLTFQIQIITLFIQFYIIWKLYFNWAIKQENKENGNDKTDK